MTSKTEKIPDYLRGKMIDMHSHFFPAPLFDSIWEYFACRNWRIRYKDSPEGLARTLQGFGVQRFVTYNYAHKQGMAAELNRWTEAFCRSHPAAIPFATVFPGDEGNVEMLQALFDRDFVGIKLQPLVSDFYPDDERMHEVYRCLLENDRILTIHAGTAPIANRYVGADNFEPVMREFPDMKVIVAHMGAFELDRFFEMVRRYPNMYLDTSVNFIDPALMADLVSRREFPPLEIPADFDPDILTELSDRILFGSDYPNIPYTYQDCIDSILDVGLGEEFNRKVFFENANRLLG